MMWKYIQSTGELFDTDGNFVAKGYAGGNCGRNPEGVNCNFLQNIKGVGPLPVGIYHRGWVVMHSQLGPYAIPLIPDQKNEMFGRGGFYMHGDKANPPCSASEGCIIMPITVRQKFYTSDDKDLEVVQK